VDPIISNPTNSQSINPYSYVGNNPLSGIDPTGYACVEVTGSHICYDAKDAEQALSVYQSIGTKIDWVNPPTSSANNGAQGRQSQQANANPTEQGSATETGKRSDGNAALALSGVEEKAVQLCAKDVRCLGAAVVTAGILYLWWNATHPDETQGPPTATDATGALKPGEERPLKPGEQVAAPPAPQPEAGSGGAMSRGPGDSKGVADIAATIAQGHAFEKHGDQYTSIGITTKEGFAKLIEGVIRDAKPADFRELSGGRTAYWDGSTGTVVIHDRNSPDLGTAFRPDNGRTFFEGLK
jgi:filamentous hemagglutinin